MGTCIGIHGSRVTAVTNELAGEHIDVVRWDENPVQYIVEALKPAKVSKVLADEDANSMDVTVDEDNLAVAIGKGGQNVRLASELTGWQINIMTAEEADKKREDEMQAATGEFVSPNSVFPKTRPARSLRTASTASRNLPTCLNRKSRASGSLAMKSSPKCAKRPVRCSGPRH